MVKHQPIEDLKTDLEWKRTYLHDLEKKKQRQKSAVADNQAEIAALRTEIADLEKRCRALEADED